MQPIVWLNTAPVYVIKGNKMNSANTAAVRVERFDNLGFVPRFEYGEMAEVSAVCGAEDGTELVYEAESALLHFAIHPSNWLEIE
jgi:hypothetical protein